ncbi:MAG TPA: hypothetical protein VJ909_09010, partial [Prolixibacteraceae bacterium]|nr:hypothetical protein [Prolixibacteraceae bacterium]
MIKCLVIGNQKSVESYSILLEGIRFFSHIEKHIIEENNPIIPYINFTKYDALIFTKAPFQIKPFIESAIKQQSNIYFTDQSWMDTDTCADWIKLTSEANNLFYIEIPELRHPMTDDFLKSYKHNSVITIHKSLNTQNEARRTLLNAVSFITLKNPIQVKKIDINSMDTSPRGKPVTKIRLKMYDHSLGYVFLTYDQNNEHILQIEDKQERFTFNFKEAYLENS